MDTILVVDDSVMLINYIEEFFQSYQDKFRTLTAKDGLEAIEVLKNQTVDLLVTDLQMPRVDGLGLLAYTHKYYPGIPCIVMSAHGTPKILEKIQSSILQFIKKPFKANQLADIVLDALKKDENDPGGSLSGISVVSFLQMVEMEQKTCICEVQSPGNPKGFFYFKGGVLHHAVFGELKGEPAAIKLINLENPTINFRRPPDRPIAKGIQRELTGLILEAVRQKDEAGTE
ncbi:MAG: response regulator [Desulfobacteraceae bacterium]|nr:response regulator [Desulfobacteraceae bacterium]